MRAVVLTRPGPVDNLQRRKLPRPDPEPGWVRIAVKAFGMQRSDLYLRLGLADGAGPFPIVPGLECVGIVDAAPGSDLQPGQQVAALMGGMGRTFRRRLRRLHRRAAQLGDPVSLRPSLGGVGGVARDGPGARHPHDRAGSPAGQSLLVRGGTSALRACGGGARA